MDFLSLPKEYRSQRISALKHLPDGQQVEYAYDGWGNVTRTWQSHDDVVNETTTSLSLSMSIPGPPSLVTSCAIHDALTKKIRQPARCSLI